MKSPGQTYVGFSEAYEERYKDHNAGKSVHTAKYRPWQLVSCHAFTDIKKAKAFEAYLKTGSGRFLQRAICGSGIPSTAPRRPLHLIHPPSPSPPQADRGYGGQAAEYYLSRADAVRREKYLKTTKGKRTLRLMLKDSLVEARS
ncbi:MAG: GIY-YIG nuclease family protein [Verrucomicrobia bacterium]|nr:GIY-YIG nuclease family protein [Verrucomicrobiota bacterium]